MKNNSNHFLNAETENLLSELGNNGFFVIRNLIPADEIKVLQRSIHRSVMEHSITQPPQGYVPGFLKVNQDIAPYLAHPRILSILNSLFGEYPRISMLTGAVNGRGIPRGDIHADWPYNQNHRSRIRAPYPDIVMNLVTMWMISDYTEENGGTILIPKSHKRNHAPRHGSDIDPRAYFEDEIQLTGNAGDVGVFDARMWHAIAPNNSEEDRIGVIVRYAPWWLNLNPIKPGTEERYQMVEITNGSDPHVELIPESVYRALPENVQQLLYHLVG